MIASLCAAVLVALVFYAVPASADYEQAAEDFGTTGEAAQLGAGVAIAINITGVGGVEPGTIYVVGRNDRVVRYGPGKEGEEPAFEEAWGWGVGDGKEEYQRCGPALVTAPAVHTFNTCTPPEERFGGEQVGHFNSPSGVAVDQATGDIFVRNAAEWETAGPIHRQRHLIEAFTATGAPIGEGFGEEGREAPSPAESISEGPEKIHRPEITSGFFEGLAVSESGVVYVTDSDFANIASPPGEMRVMSFAPEHQNDYEHYVYTGEANDITAPQGASVGLFSRVALTNGRLVVSNQEESISEYNLKGPSVPVCTYLVPGGQLQAMTANAVTGEVFYYTHADRMVHRLGPCDAETGKFTVLQAPIVLAPTPRSMYGLAVNPSLPWGPLRPEGVLYGVDDLNGIGHVFVPAKVFAPSVEAESVVGTTVNSTVLRAEINPNGFATDYRFQYSMDSVYAEQKSRAEGEGKNHEEVEDAAFSGALEAPAGTGGVLVAGGVGRASAGIGGLVANTKYRFRVVASSRCEGSSSPPCVTFGAPASFSTYPSLTVGLPDNRAYELVSPPEKQGGEVFPADPVVDSCARKQECKPPGSAILARFPMQSSANGDRVVYMGYPFSDGEGAVFNEYLSQRTASGWETSDLSPESQATKGSGSVVFNTGLGKDLLYQGSPQLSPEAPVGYQNLYLQEADAPSALTPLIASTPPNRSGASFKMEVAGASPDLSRAFFSANDVLTVATSFAPEPADPGTFAYDLYEWHEGSLVLVNVLPGNVNIAAGAKFASVGPISPDAHGVSLDGSHVFWTAGGHVYVRVDGKETLEVSSSAGFLAASTDGLEVLLSDGTIERFNTETDVYERTEDLTDGQGEFQGIVGSGEEQARLARIYYVDKQALLGSGENEGGEVAQAGQDNLYVWERGAPRFIATLGASYATDWSAATVRRTAEASPTGNWLAFSASSNGYSEVLIYDAVLGRLTCASCNPTGEAPLGPSTLRTIDAEPEWLGQPRYLTDTGRLVFDSGDRLSAADSNGDVEDVYEYEPDGVGTCVRQDGCVFLISPGTGTVDSNFLAMDETGKNVFFTTRERLVPQDKDELIDVYDAREEGGFASQTETQRTECQGEACQNTPAPPVFTTPGSATFSGAGNLLQPLVVPIAARPRKAASTVARLRAKALRKCRSQHSRRKRTACEKRARNSTRPASKTSTRTQKKVQA